MSQRPVSQSSRGLLGGREGGLVSPTCLLLCWGNVSVDDAKHVLVADPSGVGTGPGDQ